MGPIRSLWLAAVLIGLSTSVASGQASGKDELEKFNNHFRELHLKMDTSGIFALWADDGVDLMPGEAPMIGKKVIQAWVKDILAKMPGYKITKEEMEFHDIQVSGDWAVARSEAFLSPCSLCSPCQQTGRRFKRFAQQVLLNAVLVHVQY